MKVLTWVMLLITLGIALLTVRTVWGMLSLAYEVAPGSVTIHYGPSDTIIARNDILQVRVETELNGLRRIAGTSMPGVYQGRWTSDTTGPITLYATSRRPLVVIETADRRYGISPEEVEDFVAAVNSGAPGRFSPVESNSALALAALSLFPIFVLIVMMFVFSSLRRIAERMAYELTGDALLIHGSSRPIHLPYSEITDVRLESPKGIPYQMGGVALPGFYWGACSWRGTGRHLRLHATQLRPIVLIEKGRFTYGISPREPEAFLAELKRRLPSGE